MEGLCKGGGVKVIRTDNSPQGIKKMDRDYREL